MNMHAHEGYTLISNLSGMISSTKNLFLAHYFLILKDNFMDFFKNVSYLQILKTKENKLIFVLSFLTLYLQLLFDYNSNLCFIITMHLKK